MKRCHMQMQYDIRGCVTLWSSLHLSYLSKLILGQTLKMSCYVLNELQQYSGIVSSTPPRTPCSFSENIYPRYVQRPTMSGSLLPLVFIAHLVRTAEGIPWLLFLSLAAITSPYLHQDCGWVLTPKLRQNNSLKHCVDYSSFGTTNLARILLWLIYGS